MEQKDLIRELRKQTNPSSIPGVKVRQPWATWVFYRGKCEEIRTYKNNHRGLLGIMGSGWDDYFDRITTSEEYPYPYDQYCLLGIVRLVNCKCYYQGNSFRENYSRHLNPPFFFDATCYAWVFEDITPIKPLYYDHIKNKKRPDVIRIPGKMARVRIPVSEIIKRIEVLKVD